MTIKWNDLTMKRIVAPIVSLFFFKRHNLLDGKGLLYGAWSPLPAGYTRAPGSHLLTTTHAAHCGLTGFTLVFLKNCIARTV